MNVPSYLVTQAAEKRLNMAEDSNAPRSELQRWEDMAEANRIIELDFPVVPQVRFGHHRPVHPRLAKMINGSAYRYKQALESFARFKPYFLRIEQVARDPRDPSWINDFIPMADAFSIYGFLALRNPRYFVEIGSGNSTKFARRAIKDHKLRTQIVSIDPYPRAECDEICDEIIRDPLEKADLTIFRRLTSEDIVFCDNSHRAFQNSDVTVFFLDILPELASGLMVGIHDIFLPHDYPIAWLKRFYNEQYMLAAYLLGGAKDIIELPVYSCIRTPELNSLLNPIWNDAHFGKALKTGGAFWMTKC